MVGKGTELNQVVTVAQPSLQEVCLATQQLTFLASLIARNLSKLHSKQQSLIACQQLRIRGEHLRFAIIFCGAESLTEVDAEG